MLKKKAFRKIIITTFVLFVVVTIYMIPTKKSENTPIYNYIDTKDVSLYLLNSYDQLTKVDFRVNDSKIEKVIKSIINKLTISNDATIPKKFSQVIPNNIKVNNISFNDGIVNIDFSKELLELSNDEIELIIESVVYSVLELDEVKGVALFINEENISKLFSSGIPEIITKEYGINKRIEIKSINDVSKVTIFYLDKEEDTNYYVPITKYVNDNREKIKIIIDELSSNYVFESNLISLLNKNIKLLDYEIKNDSMTLDFNNSIFMEDNEILEEVVYSISYSVFANYDVNNVIFKANGEEIYKKSVKSY